MSLTEWLAECEEIEEWTALRLDAESPEERLSAALWGPEAPEPVTGPEVTGCGVTDARVTELVGAGESK